MSKKYCDWALKSELEKKYHDEEWGKPIFDDKKFFEMLVLEYMQAGLSWQTILRKREAMRAAFDNFDAEKIEKYDEKKCAELLENPDIIRNRLKIQALAHNAKIFLEIQREFGSFSEYIWAFTDQKIIFGNHEKISDIPPKTELSEQIAKDFKKRGFKFFGPTSVYAFLQSTGIVNDHLKYCHCYQK